MSRTEIPKGVRVYPPEEAERRRVLEERLFSVFRRWGFREVITPTFEYLEVFTSGAGDEGDRIFKFVDRQTGRLLALRYDITPQVARMVATTLRYRPLPLRLAYAANVFRYEEPQAGRQREFVQVGVELIGLDRPEADAEMIAMAVEGLQACGLKSFQINVGQAEFVRGFLDELQASPEERKKLTSAIRRKDALELELLLSWMEADKEVKEALLQLPSLYGGKEVLDRVAKLALNRRSQEALDNLSQVVEILEAYGLAEKVILDLGEAYALDYYTGVTFGAFSKGLGYQLSGGGRYDHLISRFGYSCPATGFAFELEKLLLALEAEEALPPVAGPDFLIIDFNPDKGQALKLARFLREQGYAVARDIIQRDLRGSLEYARAEGIGRAIVLGGHLPPDRLLVVEIGSGKEDRPRSGHPWVAEASPGCWGEVYPIEQFYRKVEAFSIQQSAVSKLKAER